MNSQSFLRTAYLWPSIVSAVICRLTRTRATLPAYRAGHNSHRNPGWLISGISSNPARPECAPASTKTGDTRTKTTLTGCFDSAARDGAIKRMLILRFSFLSVMVSSKSGRLSGENLKNKLTGKIHCALLNKHCPGGQKL